MTPEHPAERPDLIDRMALRAAVQKVADDYGADDAVLTILNRIDAAPSAVVWVKAAYRTPDDNEPDEAEVTAGPETVEAVEYLAEEMYPGRDVLTTIVRRAAAMGLCSQTHHEHLMLDARAALRELA